jgi:hypothetical protein
MFWNPFQKPNPELVPPDEKELNHTYVCECEVKWVEKGLDPKPCWACDTIVTPNCYHL